MGLPATKRTNLHEKYGASANAGNVSACRATGFQSKAHQSARKVRLPRHAENAQKALAAIRSDLQQLGFDASVVEEVA